MKKRRTPQEKKELSYARDGRNTVAESKYGARRAIPFRKARANRALRHAEKQALHASDDPDPFVPRTGRRSWKKIPDAPLAVYLDARLAVRAGRGMAERRTVGLLLDRGLRRARPRRFSMGGWLQAKERAPSAPPHPGE